MGAGDRLHQNQKRRGKNWRVTFPPLKHNPLHLPLRKGENVVLVGMDKIQKALKKLRPKERQAVKLIIQKLANQNFSGLDLQKLKGRDGIFRVRKGSVRIIYRMTSDDQIFILAIERRSNTTYNP